MPILLILALVVWPLQSTADSPQNERILVLKQSAGRDPETPSQQYQELLEGLERGLRSPTLINRKIDIVDIYEEPAMNLARLRRYRLVVALGTRPAQVARERFPESPLIFSMVLNPGRQGLDQLSNTTDQGIQGGIQARVAPIDYISQIRRVHPGARTVGMLYASPDFKSYAQAVIEEGRKQGLRIICDTLKSNRELIPKFKALIEEPIDLFLMLPDTAIYAKAHEYLFLEALRHKLPVMGPSINYVKAGALWGVVLSPYDIGLQTARLMEKALADERLSIEYPNRSKLTFNQVVAGKLGVSFPNDVVEKAKSEGRVVE